MLKATASDLALGLQNLLTTRKADLELSAIGKVYSPKFASTLALLLALPQKESSRVNAETLAEVDADHDALGNGIYAYTEAVLITPGVSQAAKDAAKRVRQTFIPHRSDLGDSYAEEAARAKRNRPKLAELENDLKTLPVPDNKTLLDWVKSFLDQGDSLDNLLSNRASTEADYTGKPATELRVKTIGLLRRFRQALRDEIDDHQTLPRDLEERVFAYLDELEARRHSTKTNAEAPKAPVNPPNNPTTGQNSG